MINRDKIDFWGINSRLQPLQAIVAMHELKTLDSIISKEIERKILDENLSKLKYSNSKTYKKSYRNICFIYGFV